jgi:tRNA(fMet)-specific endonuclease VapC
MAVIEYLLDTNILSAMIRDPAGPVAVRFRTIQERCATSVLVAAELRYGLSRRSDQRLERRIEEMLERLPVLAFEAPGDVHYGRIRADLERIGRPIRSNDYWIAAHALALDCTLVTANERGFRRVKGLRVENWIR